MVFYLQGMSSTQQRPSLGRFAALVNDSIENTDEDDFLPTTQKRFSEVNIKPPKRKFNNSLTTSNVIEKKRSKKSNLFHDVVPETTRANRQTSSSPPPPWLDLPTGEFVSMINRSVFSLEIIQHIFSFIPIKSLITQIGRVCRQWHQAIVDEKVRQCRREQFERCQ